MHMVGFADRPPITTLYGLADTYSGMVTALGIMFALFARASTGQGQFVDTAMYDAMLAVNERALAGYALTGEVPMRGKEAIAGPRGAFLAKDGYVALNIPTDELWVRLAGVLGRPDLATNVFTATGPARAANAETFIRPIIEGWMAGQSKEDVVNQLMAAGVPAGPVQTADEIFACPHVAARKMLVEVDDPQLGTVKFARTPVRLSDAAEVEGRPAPALGEHTAEILSRIGIGPDELAGLRAKGAI
jgi:formyl-CoA transferase